MRTTNAPSDQTPPHKPHINPFVSIAPNPRSPTQTVESWTPRRPLLCHRRTPQVATIDIMAHWRIPCGMVVGPERGKNRVVNLDGLGGMAATRNATNHLGRLDHVMLKSVVMLAGRVQLPVQ